MSCGFTVSTTVWAQATASGLDSDVCTPSRSASSAALSSRRHVTINSSRERAPDRTRPEASASPMRPPPRKATLRSLTCFRRPIAITVLLVQLRHRSAFETKNHALAGRSAMRLVR